MPELSAQHIFAILLLHRVNNGLLHELAQRTRQHNIITGKKHTTLSS